MGSEFTIGFYGNCDSMSNFSEREQHHPKGRLGVSAPEAIEQLLDAQIGLRNNRRLSLDHIPLAVGRIAMCPKSTLLTLRVKKDAPLRGNPGSVRRCRGALVGSARGPLCLILIHHGRALRYARQRGHHWLSARQRVWRIGPVDGTVYRQL